MAGTVLIAHVHPERLVVLAQDEGGHDATHATKCHCVGLVLARGLGGDDVETQLMALFAGTLNMDY